MKVLKKLIHTIFSISGFVPEHTTIARVIFLAASIYLSIFVLPDYTQIKYAMVYFGISTIVYIGFIFLVLPENGFRIKMIERWGEEKAYLYYEGFLAFAFFHNGASLTFISQSSMGTGYWSNVSPVVVTTAIVILFVAGLGVKIWSAYVVGIPIYYWKDMFLGKQVSNFVMTGPYKYFNNPMYGVGQMQLYAIALYYNSAYGLLFGAINQLLVFTFYFIVEKPFIYRTYLKPQEERV